MKQFILGYLLLLLAGTTYAQTATIYGQVTDKDGEPLIGASVYIEGDESRGVETDTEGYYDLKVEPGRSLTLVISYTGYETKKIKTGRIREGMRSKQDAVMESDNVIEGAEVVGENSMEDGGMIREGTEQLKAIPTTTGNIESLLPAIALGTTSGPGGELSSQYSVRGGNYDENLVYVNDFAIYRPQLIRAGQQEGLTFPNKDLISSLSFSSGGFDAKYGDKMSSVLDVSYKRPKDFGGSVELSGLGGSVHFEGSKKLKRDTSGFQRFRYLVGARYKTTKYLLGTLDVEGEYQPNFLDLQGYFTYDINRDWQLALIGNYNRSEYEFIPTSRNTAFGLIDFALSLQTVFEGQEVDDFTTYMGGASLTYVPERLENPFFLKFLASTYQSDENERIDILGDYLIGQVESNLGSNDFGDIVAILGAGTQHLFVRNYLTSNVTNAEFKGGWELEKDHIDNEKVTTHFLQWGAKYQNEIINDKLNEWERLDSAGYSLPFSESDVFVASVLKTENNLSSNRISAYFQDTWTHAVDSMELKFSFGVRAQYWDMNNEFIVSPRAQLLFKPRAKRNMALKLAGGLYYQPPFYRELRRLDGTINEDLLSQKSAHAVAGYTLDFDIGNVPFKFIAEAYYKHLWDLTYYDLDNVRIRYSGENDTRGYVTGLDMRLNGEFVEGAESWINISFLRARERIENVQHYKREVGSTDSILVNNVARPTDQLMSLSIFFQDHLPKNPNFKTHLNLTVGTGWAFGIPNNNIEPRNTYRFSPYHRVDIGFSAKLWNTDWKEKWSRHPLRFTKNTWISLEVFNLLQVSNQASNTWIKTIYGTQFAVPNYLTSRRINLRLRMEF